MQIGTFYGANCLVLFVVFFDVVDDFADVLFENIYEKTNSPSIISIKLVVFCFSIAFN